jgi:hypothetical protein
MVMAHETRQRDGFVASLSRAVAGRGQTVAPTKRAAIGLLAKSFVTRTRALGDAVMRRDVRA